MYVTVSCVCVIDELEEVKRQRYAVEDDIEHNMGQLSVSRSVSRAVSRASSIGPRSTTGSIRPRSMSGSSSKVLSFSGYLQVSIKYRI